MANADVNYHYDVVVKVIEVKKTTTTTGGDYRTPGAVTRDREHRDVANVSTVANDKVAAIKKAIRFLEVELTDAEGSTDAPAE